MSEELIAEALHPYPDDLVIATKGGLVRTGPNQWSPDGRPEHLRQACEGSLAPPEARPDPPLPVPPARPEGPARGVHRSARGLKDEGKIRHIGVCNVTEHELRRAQALTPVVSVQNRYNVARPDARSRWSTSASRNGWYSCLGRRSWTSSTDTAVAEHRRPPRRHAEPGGAGLAPGPLARRSLPIPGTGTVGPSRGEHRPPQR